jgi:hypothetical protein
MPSAAERFAAYSRGVIVALEAVKIEAVSKVSIWRKLGVVARVARQQARRSRTLNAIMSGVRTTVRSFSYALHQLWLEVTGTLFLVVAAFGAIALVREYTQYEAGHATAGRVAIATCFTLVFAWFGLSSFWRVRRKSQRPLLSASSASRAGQPAVLRKPGDGKA